MAISHRLSKYRAMLQIKLDCLPEPITIYTEAFSQRETVEAIDKELEEKIEQWEEK